MIDKEEGPVQPRQLKRSRPARWPELELTNDAADDEAISFCRGSIMSDCRSVGPDVQR